MTRCLCPVPWRGAATLLLLAGLACGGDAPQRSADAPPADPAAPDTAGAASPGPTSADSSGRGSPSDDDARATSTDPTESAPWTSAPVSARSSRGNGGVATLRAVRVGRHDAYDRIVFEFAEHVPDYDIRWVDRPTACGSGEAVDAGAPAALEVAFRPAVAHDDEGRITVRERAFRPALPALRTARITCDFEADVTWVLGVAARRDLRVLRLASPPRLAVDLRHR